MGTILGKISVETPRYELLAKADGFEVREYHPCVVAEVTYDPASMKRGRDGGFMVLAEYIGALGKPNNRKPEQEAAEQIAMTAPVLTQAAPAAAATQAAAAAAAATPAAAGPAADGEKIAMTAPVLTQGTDHNKAITMQFVLPSKYSSSVESVPRPNDPRVTVKPVERKKYGVVTFSGVADDTLVNAKVEQLKKLLQESGYKIAGDYMLARYNPPWTPGFFRTNEVMLPVE